MQLDKIQDIVALNHEAVFITFRRSGAAQMSIVTVGLLDNGVAFTISPGSAKLANLRRNPRCSLMVSRRDWDDYAVLEGHAQVLSPDATSIEELRLTLREVYRAGSGKEHPDWEEFDQAVQKDRRSAIIVVPEHIYYGNAG
jgi:PPOX class probable F420-dependent enzyme